MRGKGQVETGPLLSLIVIIEDLPVYASVCLNICLQKIKYYNRRHDGYDFSENRESIY